MPDIKRRKTMKIGNWARTIKKDSRFLKSENLPNALDITEIRDVMDELWDASSADGLERAATLVLNEQQRPVLLNSVIGSRRNVIPNYQVPAGCTVIGVFHTHLGILGVAFGGGDVAEALYRRHLISIVRSGRDTFALVRTATTPGVVDLDDVLACGRAAIFAYRAAGCSPQRAVFLAALELCERYGCAMYHGQGKRKISEVFLP